jgi:hypothetical protein
MPWPPHLEMLRPSEWASVRKRENWFKKRELNSETMDNQIQYIQGNTSYFRAIEYIQYGIL